MDWVHMPAFADMVPLVLNHSKVAALPCSPPQSTPTWINRGFPFGGDAGVDKGHLRIPKSAGFGGVSGLMPPRLPQPISLRVSGARARDSPVRSNTPS